MASRNLNLPSKEGQSDNQSAASEHGSKYQNPLTRQAESVTKLVMPFIIPQIQEAQLVKLHERLDELDILLRKQIEDSEKMKTDHKKWIQKKKEDCHALATALCQKNPKIGAFLDRDGLEIYLPTTLLDININELREEAHQAQELLRKDKEVLDNAPKQQKEIKKRIKVFAFLQNLIFAEIKGEKFSPFRILTEKPVDRQYVNADIFIKLMEGKLFYVEFPLNEFFHLIDTKDDMKPRSSAEEKEDSYNVTVKCPSLPEVKGFKPYVPDNV
uniref:Uncharacterized protein n=1 Tax=Panagrolaimus davidi TaxID=227884 RepID=A0A914PYG0_9BILA